MAGLRWGHEEFGGQNRLRHRTTLKFTRGCANGTLVSRKRASYYVVSAQDRLPRWAVPQEQQIELLNQATNLFEQPYAETKLTHCSDVFCPGEINLIV